MPARAYLDGTLKLVDMISDRFGLDRVDDGVAALKRGETACGVMGFGLPATTAVMGRT